MIMIKHYDQQVSKYFTSILYRTIRTKFALTTTGHSMLSKLILQNSHINPLTRGSSSKQKVPMNNYKDTIVQRPRRGVRIIFNSPHDLFVKHLAGDIYIHQRRMVGRGRVKPIQNLYDTNKDISWIQLITIVTVVISF